MRPYRSDPPPECEHTAPMHADLSLLAQLKLVLVLCSERRVRERAPCRLARYPCLLPLIVIRSADWGELVGQRVGDAVCEALDADAASATTMPSFTLSSHRGTELSRRRTTGPGTAGRGR